MNKILIPTDFSENAMNALRYAVELFKYERCVFFIVHAYADEVYSHNDLVSRNVLRELRDRVRKNSDRELIDTIEVLKEILPNPEHEYNVSSVFAHLVDECNDIVDRENIDILIMGTKGKTADNKLTFGSNTVQVLKYVKSPVLVVPENCKYRAPKNVLFPTDYQLPYKRRELKLLSTLLNSFRSKVHFLYISQFNKLSIRQEDNIAFLKETLIDPDLEFQTRPFSDRTEGINDFIRDNGIDLLVMVNSRHSYLESVLYQSTIDKIGLQIEIPFLVMQNLQRN